MVIGFVMSVIKLSPPAASCWTVWVAEGHNPAAELELSENRKIRAPWLVSHAPRSSAYSGFTHDFPVNIATFLQQGAICHKTPGL